MRPRDIFLQPSPIKSWARIFFSIRRNMLMSRDVGNGVLLAQGFAKRSKTFILCCLKAFTLQPFKLYAYRVVIAIGPTPIT